MPCRVEGNRPSVHEVDAAALLAGLGNAILAQREPSARDRSYAAAVAVLGALPMMRRIPYGISANAMRMAAIKLMIST